MPRKHLERASWLIVAVLFACALLDSIGRAGWTFRPYPSTVGLVADHPAWTFVLLATGGALAAALVARRHRALVMGTAGAWLILWGGALLWWASEMPPPPPSILGPVLAVACGGAATVLSRAWDDEEG